MAKARSDAVADTDTSKDEGFIRGRSVANLGRGMALVQIGHPKRVPVRPDEKTTVLVQKAARALNKPGIDKGVVFSGPNAARIFAYSVDPHDPRLVVRESADGQRTVGRLVDGKFRPLRK